MRHDSNKPRLHRRSLKGEPLTVQDWELIYYAYIGFQRQVEMIVALARQRLEAGAPRF